MDLCLFSLLIGKSVKIHTDAGVDVVLEIKEIRGKSTCRDLEPSTQANDWWPKQEITNSYVVEFTNGYIKVFSTLESIEFIS